MTTHLIKNGNQYEYPIDNINDRPIYRKDASGNEFYEYINNTYLIGTNSAGQQIYARDKDKNEIYPPDNTYAFRRTGNGFYAKSKDGRTVFPKNGRGDEFYLFYADEFKTDSIPDRYAKTATNAEIYPKKMIRERTESEAYIHYKYAVDENGKRYYAKDCYNNEYYRTKLPSEEIQDIILERYAVTNDGKIILPYDVVARNYHIDPNKQPEILQENVLGKLIRFDPTAELDYVTDIELPITTARKTYHYMELNSHFIVCVPAPKIPQSCNVIGIINKPELPFYKQCYFWIPIVVLLILKVFIIWWFHWRKP